MRTALVLMLAAVPAFAQYPPGVAVKVSEYVLQDGKRIGIAEWTTLTAVPCEVQGQPKVAKPCSKCADCDCGTRGGCACEARAATKAKAAKCAICADCDCGNCVCDREAAQRAAKVERPRQEAPVPAVVLPANDTPLWIDWSNGTRTLGTVGEYIRLGGDPLKIRTTTVAAPVATPMPVYAPPVYYSQPVYTMPPRGLSAGFNVSGPFGGGFGAGACVGGR